VLLHSWIFEDLLYPTHDVAKILQITAIPPTLIYSYTSLLLSLPLIKSVASPNNIYITVDNESDQMVGTTGQNDNAIATSAVKSDNMALYITIGAEITSISIDQKACRQSGRQIRKVMMALA
jgi:hypothetical protein